MKVSIKERILQARDFVVARGKLVFPVLLIAAVAVTVTVALKMSAGTVNATSIPEPEAASLSDGDALAELTVPDVPLELNAYPELNSLVMSYFEAMAAGDADAIAAIQSGLDDMERIRIEELGKYIEGYPAVEVYSKPGPEENSYIVIAYTRVIMSYYPDDYLPGYTSFYVCTNAEGKLYINKESVPEEVSEYIRKVILQDDVVELCNKIEVEYKDICLNKPELFTYMSEVEQEVRIAAGGILASQINEGNGGDAVPADGNSVVNEPEGTDGDGSSEPEAPPAPVQTGPVYATATTTVNVRSSDSETADKLGKVSGGTKVEVLEQKANGWSRIVYENGEGYIKSEFLEVAESASGVETIGTVTATANVNVRVAPNETAEKLGIAAGGETLNLVGTEGDWSKVIYNGQIGYVKSEYVQ